VVAFVTVTVPIVGACGTVVAVKEEDVVEAEVPLTLFIAETATV
jgi:hypothetical protein